MRTALNCLIVPYHGGMPKYETSDDTDENQWMIHYSQACGIRDTRAVAYVEGEEPFSSKIFLGSEYDIRFLVNCVFDSPAFDPLGMSHLSKSMNLRPRYLPIEAL